MPSKKIHILGQYSSIFSEAECYQSNWSQKSKQKMVAKKLNKYHWIEHSVIVLPLYFVRLYWGDLLILVYSYFIFDEKSRVSIHHLFKIDFVITGFKCCISGCSFIAKRIPLLYSFITLILLLRNETHIKKLTFINNRCHVNIILVFHCFWLFFITNNLSGLFIYKIQEQFTFIFRWGLMYNSKAYSII